jgi:hypothetical protein
MKFSTISLTFAAALAFGLASCSKNEPVTLTTDDANKAVGSTADTLANTALAVAPEPTREVNLVGKIRDILKARA